MCVSFFTRENALRTVHHCRCRQTDFEWHNGPSESPFHFPAKPASVWLHWPMNGGTGTERGTERRKNGWRAGRGNRHLCPGDAQTHTDSHTQMFSVIQPAHGISTLFMNVYICSSQPLLCVCMCVLACVTLKLSWSLGISVQTNTFDSSHVGNRLSAGQSKGNPLTTEGDTCSYTMGDLYQFH